MNKGRIYLTMLRRDIDFYHEKGSQNSLFLQWFVGFTDAEGNLSINRIFKKYSLNIYRFSFLFKISLHKVLSPIPLMHTSIGHYPDIFRGVRLFSSTSEGSTSSILNPHWVTGFVDAEGCFMIKIRKQKGATGWGVGAIFALHLHIIDLHLLHKIQSFFLYRKYTYRKKK